MSTTPTAGFSSALAPVLARYVELKRSLGRTFQNPTDTLKSLDRFSLQTKQKIPGPQCRCV